MLLLCLIISFILTSPRKKVFVFLFNEYADLRVFMRQRIAIFTALIMITGSAALFLFYRSVKATTIISEDSLMQPEDIPFVIEGASAEVLEKDGKAFGEWLK